MSIAKSLQQLLQAGVHRIGQLEFQAIDSNRRFIACHWQDSEQARQADFGGLEVHDGPSSARDLSTYADDGSYRFTKGQTNLKRGWVMILENPEDLRMALDQFYPAAVGMVLAARDGTLEIENLRDKLSRQSGMYRNARLIRDDDAQRLVREVCGPAHQCAKRILWRMDEHTPLDDSEASRYNGIPGDVPENEAIPLLCREACNHFVAECCRVVKEGGS